MSKRVSKILNAEERMYELDNRWVLAVLDTIMLVGLIWAYSSLGGCVDKSYTYDFDVTAELPDDSDEDITPSEDPADDDDSTVVQDRNCDIYLPSEPQSAPFCFAPSGVIPQVETLTDGMLVQLPLGDTRVMYYILKGRRYLIPTLQRFTSWRGEDACEACSGVANVAQELIASVEVGGNVTARPGTIIAIEADTSLFVIDACATARAILPSVAEVIYGKGWEEFLVNFPYKPEFAFVDYAMGPPVESLADFDLASALARTIDEEVLGIGCGESEEDDPLEGEILAEIRTATDLAPQTLVRGEWASEIFALEIEAFAFDLNVPWMMPQMVGDSTPISDGVDQGVSASSRFGYCFLSDGSQTLSDYVPASTYWSVDVELMVPAWTTSRIGIWCAVGNAMVQDDDPDEFAIVLPSSQDIQVELSATGELVDPACVRVGADGGGVNLDFGVFTQIVNQGELYLSLSGASPTGTITAGTENMLAVYQMAADYEGYNVSELSMSFTGGVQYLESVKIWWIDPYGYVHEQTSTVVPYGGTTFAGMTSLSAPKAFWQDILLFAEIAADAPPGTQVQAHLNAWNLPFAAVGQRSGTALDAADIATTIAGNVLTIN